MSDLLYAVAVGLFVYYGGPIWCIIALGHLLVSVINGMEIE